LIKLVAVIDESDQGAGQPPIGVVLTNAASESCDRRGSGERRPPSAQNQTRTRIFRRAKRGAVIACCDYFGSKLNF
jgi:hypothetical protein